MGDVNILIADDHELLRRGLIAMVREQPGWEVVGEADNGRDAVAYAAQRQPDVAILDISMPELNGLEATRQILEASPETKVLILTMHDSEQVVRDVLDAGAQGYLLKSDAGRDMLAAVTALLQDRPFFTSKVARMVLDGYLRPNEHEIEGSLLSAREREIVQLLAEGNSNKEVAAALGISVKTAETHRTNIMRKMNFRSITDLVRYAIRNQIIQA
jgi:DNA-binding NarL/FixJ family response regulator